MNRSVVCGGLRVDASLSLVLLLACALLSVGCRKGGGFGPQGGQPPVPVVVVEAKTQPVVETLSLVGSVAANEMVELKCEIDGTVEEIGFKEGQRVEPGHLLIKLDETKLAAQLAEAEANFKLSQTTFERSKQLYAGKLISQQEYDQAAATFDVNRASLELKKRQLKDARIYAPFKGVVGARSVSPGQVISRNTPLTVLVDADPVKVEFNVPERFLSQVRVGQTIELMLAAYPGERFKGQVFFVAPKVDVDTRTALVKAQLPNPEYRLKPGMFANLDLALNVREQAVVVPESALILNGDQAMVFVVDQEQAAQMRPVNTGVRLPGLVEVTSGLTGGERVITEGFQKVRPGGKVVTRAAEGGKPTKPEEGKASVAAQTSPSS